MTRSKFIEYSAISYNDDDDQSRIIIMNTENHIKKLYFHWKVLIYFG